MKVGILRYEKFFYNSFFNDLYKCIEVGLGSADIRSLSAKYWYKNKDLFEFDVIAMIGLSKPYSERGFYSDAAMMHQNKRGGRCLIFERGYIGDRKKYWSVGFDGLNGRAHFNNINMPKDRFEKLNTELDRINWNYNGDVLFCLQLPWDSSVSNVQYPKFVEKTVKKILNTTDKNIVLRKHPLYDKRKKTKKKNNYRAKICIEMEKVLDFLLSNKRVSLSYEKELRSDLVNKSCLVTFNSNSAVDAMILGMPSIVLDDGSMISDIAYRSIYDISSLNVATVLKIRMQKLYDIAYAQWSGEEISSGEVFRHLGII